jgi:hypothetical protein
MWLQILTDQPGFAKWTGARYSPSMDATAAASYGLLVLAVEGARDIPMTYSIGPLSPSRSVTLLRPKGFIALL